MRDPDGDGEDGCTADPTDRVCFWPNLCREHRCTRIDCNCEGPT